MLNVLRVTFVLLGVGLLFEAVGFACPGWLILSFRETSTNMGLWYVIVCDSSLDKEMSKCITRSYVDLLDEAAKSLPDSSDPGSNQIVTWEVMATVSLVSTLMAIGLTRNVYVHYKSSLPGGVPYFNRSQTGLAMFASCLSGILMLIPVGKFGYYNSTVQSLINAYTTSSDMSLGVPYGQIVGCLGACLVLLASCLYSCSSAETMDNSRLLCMPHPSDRLEVHMSR